MGSVQVKDPGTLSVSTRLKTVSAVFSFIGLVVFVVTLINNPQRAWLAYLIPFFYFTSLALGGLFFTAIQHVTKAGWSVNIRRVSEALTSFLPYALVFGLIFLIGAPHLYKWLNPELVAADPLLIHKKPYLNSTFFIIRMALFFGLWLMFKSWIVGKSIEQDKTGDDNITHKLVGKSIAFILVFALSYSFFSVDLLMSLEPHWFSTIFGVYTFAGLFQSTLAFLILILLYLRRKGLMEGYVTGDHFHDLGKFLFAFTVFWAYIAFSQYMLIWYANLPEETIFIIPRSEHGWVYVSLLLLIGKFIVPFLALLPKWAKRSHAQLGVVSAWILLMQYVDLYWLAYPSLHEEDVLFSLPEVGIFLGFLGVFMFGLTRFLSTHKLVPIKDPRIHESLHHHVVY
jgi:hypothetical protein